MGAKFENRLSDVAYVDAMATLVTKFVDGRVYAVVLAELDGPDASGVRRVSLGSDGYAAVIEQESGNRLEVPWDVILYHAEPEYPFYKYGKSGKYSSSTIGDFVGTDRRRSEEIGERVRLERAKRCWTLADLSRRTGIKVPNISRLEKGRHMPSLDTLEKVADALGVPVAALVATGRLVGMVPSSSPTA